MNARRLVSYVIVAALAGLGGLLVRGWMEGEAVMSAGKPGDAARADGPCPGGAAALYWRAPMDPAYVRDAPGKSPMGMDLVPVCPDEGGAAPAGMVSIDPTIVQNIAVRTAPALRRDLTRKLRTVGRVTYDERLIEHVHTKIQGWVEKLHVEFEGQTVKKGEPLLEVYSPELVSTQEELLLASRYRDVTAESPFADVREGGEALLKASRRRLELWDIPRRDIDRLLAKKEIRKNLTLYSHTQGVVTHMMVRHGMQIGPNDNLYTIADLSRVWLYADVYEYELPWVRVGQRATVQLSYLPGTTFEGEVAYVYPFLDPKTRTARVRIELPNPDGTLKPDMYANVTIDTEPRSQVIVVPDEAIIRSGTRSLAIVALGGGRFRPVKVKIGLDSGDGWLEIREGLEEGDEVVISSQFLIDSESRLKEAIQKLHAKPAIGTDPEGEGAEAPAPDQTGMDHEGHAMGEE